MLNPEDLFRYADRYARRAEAAGKGTQYPTFRMAAKRFRVPMDEIEQACADYQGDGYMQPATGYGVGGNVGMRGAARIATRGEWLVEAYA